VPADLRPRHVPLRPLAGLAALLGVRTAGRDAPGPLTRPGTPRGVSGITHDSRRVHPGDLYAALPGSQHHGATFCVQAAAAGAAAILTDAAGKELAIRSGLPVFVVGDPRSRLGEIASWIYGNPSAKLTLLGVTGTSGKTTTTYLLEAGLRAASSR
jgi:UDP-N-acetylmuramoyl-L-alanyl-D-glutamate--2,6-diaminopimelate ligase